jgi:hypothetical protein
MHGQALDTPMLVNPGDDPKGLVGNIFCPISLKPTVDQFDVGLIIPGLDHFHPVFVLEDRWRMLFALVN